MIKKTITRTGAIFYDLKNQWECLWVGDYGKDKNVKANFLGLTTEINGVFHEDVDLSEKLVITLSTQKGCPMNCEFCDVPKLNFKGNLSLEELQEQVDLLIKDAGVPFTKRLNLHYARMGEPTFNFDVLTHASNLKYNKVKGIDYETLHPVISTMLPKNNKGLVAFINAWVDIKNKLYKGEAGLQFSINSTDEEQRNKMFRNKSLSLLEISELAANLKKPVGRKYTLNFAVTKDTILDAEKLDLLFNKDNFIVKLTPIHETSNALENDYDIDGYKDYNVYKKFEQPLLDLGWDVIVFVPSKEEDDDRITCGNAIITEHQKEG